MKSILSPSKYARPELENPMLRDEYWERLERDDESDDEEVFDDDDIDEF